MRSCASSSCSWLKRSKRMMACVMIVSYSCSALGPRQAGVPPATDAVALAVGVAVALEALEHVVGLAVAEFGGQPRGLVGTDARAAHEHHQRLGIDRAPQLLREGRIGRVAGIEHPFDLDR